MMGRAAFLAPWVVTEPSSRAPPRIRRVVSRRSSIAGLVRVAWRLAYRWPVSRSFALANSIAACSRAYCSASAPAAFCRSIASLRSRCASATTTSSKRIASSTRTVTRSGNACMNPSLVASSSRDVAPPWRTFARKTPGLNAARKRRVLGKDAFLAFRGYRDNELGLAFEDDLRRRYELERDRISHASCAPRSPALPRSSRRKRTHLPADRRLCRRGSL